MSHKSDERYLLCTEKEQAWLDEYSISGNIELATLTAYDMTDKDAARGYGLTVAARPRIAALIKEYIAQKPTLYLPTQEELRAMYIELYHLAEDARVKLAALRDYERVSGFKAAKPAGADTFDPLQDIQG